MSYQWTLADPEQGVSSNARIEFLPLSSLTAANYWGNMKKSIKIGLALLTVVVTPLAGVTAASADEQSVPTNSKIVESEWNPLDVVRKLGNLATAENVGSQHQNVALDARATAPEQLAGPRSLPPLPGAEELLITPVVPKELSVTTTETDGIPVTVYTEPTHGYVIGTNSSGNSAGFVAIKDSSAPADYKFSITSASGTPVLELQKDGSILVKDSAENVMNSIQKPWATDSAGKNLSTSYTVDGNVITQHVNLADAVFPVVADPSFSCGFLNCTIQFNRSETNDWATAGPVGLGGLVGICGVGGVAALAACGVGAASIAASAIVANNHGECVEFHFAGAPPVGTWWPWTYSGGYCN